MSDDIIESSSCPTYAVVDKKKARRNEKSENIALYAAVDKTKKVRAKANYGENKNENLESKATDSTTMGGNHPEPPVLPCKYTPKTTKEINLEDKLRKVKSEKIFTQPILIMLIIFALSLLAIVFIITTAISYSMISRLRSEIDVLKSIQLEVEMLQSTCNNTSTNFIKWIDQQNDTIFTLKIAAVDSLLGKIKEIDLLNETSTLNTTAIVSLLGKNRYFPAPSCWVLHLLWPSSSSGYYWVTSSNGTSVCVYCEMTKSCGNITGGLTRIAILNNENRQQICSDILTLTMNNTRCTQTKSSCSQILFPSKQIFYSHICGLLEGYLSGAPDGFHGRSRSSSTTINDNYVDGISLTYGTTPNRTHIWTFIGDEEPMNPQCPRDIRKFVGDSYSCIVWEGFCSGNSNRCTYRFFRQLQHHVTDDIEMRICLDEASGGSISVGKIEIYVW